MVICSFSLISSSAELFPVGDFWGSSKFLVGTGNKHVEQKLMIVMQTLSDDAFNVHASTVSTSCSSSNDVFTLYPSLM